MMNSREWILTRLDPVRLRLGSDAWPVSGCPSCLFNVPHLCRGGGTHESISICLIHLLITLNPLSANSNMSTSAITSPDRSAAASPDLKQSLYPPTRHKLTDSPTQMESKTPEVDEAHNHELCAAAQDCEINLLQQSSFFPDMLFIIEYPTI